MSFEEKKRALKAIEEFKRGKEQPLKKMIMTGKFLLDNPGILSQLYELSSIDNKAEGGEVDDDKDAELKLYIKSSFVCAVKIIEEQGFENSVFDEDNNLIVSKCNRHTQCITGIFQFFEQEDFFRSSFPTNANNRKFKKNKRDFFNRRWNAKMSGDVYRKDSKYLEVARQLIPFIDEYLKKEKRRFFTKF